MQTGIELYGAVTGNCLRAAIALEETEIDYVVRQVDLRRGQHRDPAYLMLNPAGKVPTMVERLPDKPPFVLSQSNAIILFAAERAPPRLVQADGAYERALIYERFFYFVTDVIARNHAAFFLQARDAGSAASMLDNEALDMLVKAERFVTHASYMAGENFSIADISAFTIARAMKDQIPWTLLPNLQRWYTAIDDRPAVKRGLRAFNSKSE